MFGGPAISFLRTIGLLLTGRIKLPKERNGEEIVLDDGATWVIFRQLYIKGPKGAALPGAVFRPIFTVQEMTVEQNVRFSRFPIPFYIGLPGFRSKTWLFSKSTGAFCGIYEWQTPDDADSYSRSFAARFMKKRSVPGSVSFTTYPGSLKDYFDHHLKAGKRWWFWGNEPGA